MAWVFGQLVLLRVLLLQRTDVDHTRTVGSRLTPNRPDLAWIASTGTITQRSASLADRSSKRE